jgi:hypothetical protein
MSKRSETTRVKIEMAFDALRDDGYIAEMDWCCCQNCGWRAIDEQHGGDCNVVFFHAQDADQLDEEGQCLIAWRGDGEHIKQRFREARRCGRRARRRRERGDE